MNNFSQNRRRQIYELTSGKCFYCGCKLDFSKFHVDHFIAKSKGGKKFKNVVPACPECNMIKGNKDLEEFRETIESYLHKDIHVNMICKYMKVIKKPVIFYFEKKNINIF